MLTPRQEYIKVVVQSLTNSESFRKSPTDKNIEVIAELAVKIADAVVAAEKKGVPQQHQPVMGMRRTDSETPSI